MTDVEITIEVFTKYAIADKLKIAIVSLKDFKADPNYYGDFTNKQKTELRLLESLYDKMFNKMWRDPERLTFTPPELKALQNFLPDHIANARSRLKGFEKVSREIEKAFELGKIKEKIG